MQHQAGKQLPGPCRAPRELCPATVTGVLKINLVSDPKENRNSMISSAVLK